MYTTLYNKTWHIILIRYINILYNIEAYYVIYYILHVTHVCDINTYNVSYI